MGHKLESMSQVRALAASYADGEISRASYLKKRAELVRMIVKGEMALEYTIPAPDEQTVREFNDFMLDLGVDDPVPRRSRRLPLFAGAITAAVLLVGIGAWWLAGPSPDSGSTMESVDISPGEAHLRAFLEAGDWSDEALDALSDDWNTLNSDSRNDARSSVAWRRLQSALRTRINEQQVLAGLDETGSAAEKVEKLREFQEALNE